MNDRMNIDNYEYLVWTDMGPDGWSWNGFNTEEAAYEYMNSPHRGKCVLTRRCYMTSEASDE